MVFVGIPGLTQTKKSCLLYESKKFPSHFYEFAPRERYYEYRDGKIPYRCLGCQKSSSPFNKSFSKRSTQIMVIDDCFLTDPDEFTHLCSPYPRLLEIGRQVYREVNKEMEGNDLTGNELIDLIIQRLHEKYPEEVKDIVEVMSRKRKNLFQRSRANILKKIEITNEPPQIAFEERNPQSDFCLLEDNNNDGFQKSATSSNTNSSGNHQLQLPQYNKFHYHGSETFGTSLNMDSSDSHQLKLPPFNAFYSNFHDSSPSSATNSSNMNSYGTCNKQFKLPPFNSFHYSLPRYPTMPSIIYAGFRPSRPQTSYSVPPSNNHPQVFLNEKHPSFMQQNFNHQLIPQQNPLRNNQKLVQQTNSQPLQQQQCHPTLSYNTLPRN